MPYLNGFPWPRDIKKDHLAGKFAGEGDIRTPFICWNTFQQAYT